MRKKEREIVDEIERMQDKMAEHIAMSRVFLEEIGKKVKNIDAYNKRGLGTMIDMELKKMKLILEEMNYRLKKIDDYNSETLLRTNLLLKK